MADVLKRQSKFETIRIEMLGMALQENQANFSWVYTYTHKLASIKYRIESSQVFLPWTGQRQNFSKYSIINHQHVWSTWLVFKRGTKEVTGLVFTLVIWQSKWELKCYLERSFKYKADAKYMYVTQTIKLETIIWVMTVDINTYYGWVGISWQGKDQW